MKRYRPPIPGWVLPAPRIRWTRRKLRRYNRAVLRRMLGRHDWAINQARHPEEFYMPHHHERSAVLRGHYLRHVR